MSSHMLTRRGAFKSLCKHCVGFSALTGTSQVLAQAASVPVTSPDTKANPGRFDRPGIETDEGGLWGMMDREEAKLRRSPFVIRDAALTKYVQDITCRLSGDHCPDIRVHLVRTPLFNASMAPNGMMQVWSGLLLRVENEAQLAAILGHEIGHYLERHSLERMRDAKSRAAAAQFMALFGAIGALGQLGMLAGMSAFSRDQEASADRAGMRLMQNAGYDGQQAARVWSNLIGELKIKGGEKAGTRNPMMASHPPAATRRDDLLRLAGDKPGETGANEFAKATVAHRMTWLLDEIKRGQYEESLVLFDRLIGLNANDAQILFARGEVFRQRDSKDDVQLSVDDLNRSAQLDNPPVEVFRSLGLVHKKQQSTALALQSFEKYLAAAPEAADSSLIKNYINDLKP
jgi:beta-barrel assembly-enhancing protease